MGISPKLMRIVKKLYYFAMIWILQSRLSSRIIPVKEGLTQGKTLSALLFSLYITDVIASFENNGPSELQLCKGRGIHLMLYVNDVIFLAISWHDTQRQCQHFLLAEWSLGVLSWNWNWSSVIFYAPVLGKTYFEYLRVTWH